MTWNYIYTPSIWPSFLTVLLMLTMAFFSARRRSMPGVLPFLIGCLFGAAWAFGSGMEYAAVDWAAKIFWVKFQAAWQLPTVTAVTCFVLEFAWPRRWVTRRNLALLSIAPLLVFGLVLSDDALHLMWRSFDGFNGTLNPQLNSLGWAAIFYSFGLVILNLIVFTWLFIHSPQHRWPVAIMVAGHIGVRTLFILEKANVIFSDLPLDVLGLAFVDVTYAIVLFGFRLFDPIPVARRTAIEQLRDGMLVLDAQGQLANLNPAAVRILGASLKQAQGISIWELLPELPHLNPVLTGAAFLSRPIEMSFGSGAETRFYELEFSPLCDFRALPVGHLLLLHDVTEQHRSQAQILEQQRALATSRERERLARELHDELSQELSYINVQAQTIDDLLASGNVEQASAQLRLLAKIARETHMDVRGQITKLSLVTSQQDGFVGALRHFVEEFIRMYGIPTELTLSGDPADFCLDSTAELQLLRITQEAFTNIRKHACAQNIQVGLERTPAWITLSIQDDGTGFASGESSTEKRTFGLSIMSERAAEIGGKLEIRSIPGQGTRIVVEVPVIPQP